MHLMQKEEKKNRRVRKNSQYLIQYEQRYEENWLLEYEDTTKMMRQGNALGLLELLA